MQDFDGSMIRQMRRAKAHGMVNSGLISDIWTAVAAARLNSGDHAGAEEAARKAKWMKPDWRAGKIA